MSFPDPLIVSQSKLVAEVEISGAKNSALRLLAASILTEQPIKLYGIPSTLLDIEIHIEMLEKLGKTSIGSGPSVQIIEGERR